MKKNKWINLAVRNIAFFLCIAMLFPNVMWAFTPAIYQPAGPILGIQCFGKPLELPEKFGIVDHCHQGGPKTIICVQDLHCNYEVQMNIAKIIHHFARENGLKLVGEEGAAGLVDTGLIKEFQDKKIAKTITDFFVKQGKITGAEYYAATGPIPVQLVGIETPSLYSSNRQTVRHFLNDESIGYCYDIRDALDRVKADVYNPALKMHDKKKEAYQSGQLPLLRYCVYLAKTAGRLKQPLAGYPCLVRYLDKDHTASRNKTDLPALYNEMDKIDRSIRDVLYTTPQQQELDLLYHRLVILEKALNISLTPIELKEFRANREQFRINRFIQFIHKSTSLPDAEIPLTGEWTALEDYLKEVDLFYQIADQRSRDFVDNMLAVMEQGNETLALMVSGGFHSDILLRDLEEKNVSFITVTPFITSHDVVNPYFDLLRERRLPIEKLLEKNQDMLQLASCLKNGLSESESDYQAFAKLWRTSARTYAQIPEATGLIAKIGNLFGIRSDQTVPQAVRFAANTYLAENKMELAMPHHLGETARTFIVKMVAEMGQRLDLISLPFIHTIGSIGLRRLLTLIGLFTYVPIVLLSAGVVDGIAMVLFNFPKALYRSVDSRIRYRVESLARAYLENGLHTGLAGRVGYGLLLAVQNFVVVLFGVPTTIVIRSFQVGSAMFEPIYLGIKLLVSGISWNEKMKGIQSVFQASIRCLISLTLVMMLSVNILLFVPGSAPGFTQQPGARLPLQQTLKNAGFMKFDGANLRDGWIVGPNDKGWGSVVSGRRYKVDGNSVFQLKVEELEGEGRWYFILRSTEFEQGYIKIVERSTETGVLTYQLSDWLPRGFAGEVEVQLGVTEPAAGTRVKIDFVSSGLVGNKGLTGIEGKQSEVQIVTGAPHASLWVKTVDEAKARKQNIAQYFKAAADQAGGTLAIWHAVNWFDHPEMWTLNRAPYVKPLFGQFNSTDPRFVQWAVGTAKLLGIDGFSFDLNYRVRGRSELKKLQQYFSTLEKEGLNNNSICIETKYLKSWQDIVADVEWIVNNFGNSPAYQHIGGIPVVHFFGMLNFSPADYKRARQALEQKGIVVLFVGDQISGVSTYLEEFSAFHPWVKPGQPMEVGWELENYIIGRKLQSVVGFAGINPNFHDNNWGNGPERFTPVGEAADQAKNGVYLGPGQTMLGEIERALKYKPVAVLFQTFDDADESHMMIPLASLMTKDVDGRPIVIKKGFADFIGILYFVASAKHKAVVASDIRDMVGNIQATMKAMGVQEDNDAKEILNTTTKNAERIADGINAFARNHNFTALLGYFVSLLLLVASVVLPVQSSIMPAPGWGDAVSLVFQSLLQVYIFANLYRFLRLALESHHAMYLALKKNKDSLPRWEQFKVVMFFSAVWHAVDCRFSQAQSATWQQLSRDARASLSPWARALVDHHETFANDFTGTVGMLIFARQLFNMQQKKTSHAQNSASFSDMFFQAQTRYAQYNESRYQDNLVAQFIAENRWALWSEKLDVEKQAGEIRIRKGTFDVRWAPKSVAHVEAQDILHGQTLDDIFLELSAPGWAVRALGRYATHKNRFFYKQVVYPYILLRLESKVPQIRTRALHHLQTVARDEISSGLMSYFDYIRKGYHAVIRFFQGVRRRELSDHWAPRKNQGRKLAVSGLDLVNLLDVVRSANEAEPISVWRSLQGEKARVNRAGYVPEVVSIFRALDRRSEIPDNQALQSILAFYKNRLQSARESMEHEKKGVSASAIEIGARLINPELAADDLRGILAENPDGKTKDTLRIQLSDSERDGLRAIVQLLQAQGIQHPLLDLIHTQIINQASQEIWLVGQSAYELQTFLQKTALAEAGAVDKEKQIGEDLVYHVSGRCADEVWVRKIKGVETVTHRVSQIFRDPQGRYVASSEYNGRLPERVSRQNKQRFENEIKPQLEEIFGAQWDVLMEESFLESYQIYFQVGAGQKARKKTAARLLGRKFIRVARNIMPDQTPDRNLDMLQSLNRYLADLYRSSGLNHAGVYTKKAETGQLLETTEVVLPRFFSMGDAIQWIGLWSNVANGGGGDFTVDQDLGQKLYKERSKHFISAACAA